MSAFCHNSCHCVCTAPLSTCNGRLIKCTMMIISAVLPNHSTSQSIHQFLKWPKWHSHYKDHWLGDISKLHQYMIGGIRNVLTVDEKLTVNLQRRRQVAVCSRCLEPQPQKLDCTDQSLDQWPSLSIRRCLSLSTYRIGYWQIHSCSIATIL